MSNGQLTLFTAIRPATLGKTYCFGAKGIEKTTAGDLCEGRFSVTEFACATTLAALLLEIGTDQAISASLPKSGAPSGKIVTKAASPENPNALTRTKEDFGFPHGQRGLMVLDYDPPPTAKAFEQPELWKLLCVLMPELKRSGVVWWCSGSSFIFNGESEIQGLRGQRLYILVSDLSDTERFGEVLAKRLWLAGYGYIVVSSSGQRLVRSVFDAAMFQAARLDFIGGAVCQSPLEQKRGLPIVLSEGGWLDTRRELPDLTCDEENAYERLVEDCKAKAEPASRIAREEWKAARTEQAILNLTHAGVPIEHAAERVERTLAAALGGVLLGDFALTLADGKVVTVGDVLDNRERFQSGLTLDPLEPEYLNRKVTGKLYLFGSSPILYSFAHGGAAYRLQRQPSRFYVQRGRKAELTNEICALLSNEPDVFIRGGVLVTVGNGRVRALRKHGLMHLISSRSALYTKNEKGRDMPADLPGEVVDMVIDAVGSFV